MKQTTLRSGGYTTLPALFCRRYPNPNQIAYPRGKRYENEKKIISNESGVNQHTSEVGVQIEHRPKTSAAIGEEYGVAPATILRSGMLPK